MKFLSPQRVARVRRTRVFRFSAPIRHIAIIGTFAIIFASLAQSSTSQQSQNDQFLPHLLAAAHERTTHTVRY